MQSNAVAMIGYDPNSIADEMVSAGLFNKPYSWVGAEAARLALSWVCDLGKGTEEEVVIRAREIVSREWPALDDQQRFEMAKQIIKGWGGIRKISDESIRRHIGTVSKHESFPFEGVASYSKLLAFIYPDRYAILDSRVGLSVHILFRLTAKDCSICFPYPHGRSKFFKAAHLCLAQNVHRDTDVMKNVQRSSAYRFYTKFVRELSTTMGRPVQEIEMALFMAPSVLMNRIKEGGLVA